MHIEGMSSAPAPLGRQWRRHSRDGRIPRSYSTHPREGVTRRQL